MEDVAATVRRLRERALQADRARTGAEYARQQAEQAVAESEAAIKSEFGVSGIEEARSLYGDLDRKIAAEAQAIEAALNGAGT